MTRKWLITDDTGWLRVLIDNTRIESLPEFLQVDYEGIKINVPTSVQNGSTVTTAKGTRVTVTQNNRYFRTEDRPGLEREFFTIIEGLHRNKKASVKARAQGSWFGNAAPTSSANLKFTTTKNDGVKLHGKLAFSSHSIDAFTDASNPIPEGMHILHLPDAPHRGGNYYVEDCERPHTWFRIGSNGNRYVHPGRGSAGCLTVPPAEWNRLYWYLIKARKGDYQNVGMLHVVNAIR